MAGSLEADLLALKGGGYGIWVVSEFHGLHMFNPTQIPPKVVRKHFFSKISRFSGGAGQITDFGQNAVLYPIFDP